MISSLKIYNKHTFPKNHVLCMFHAHLRYVLTLWGGDRESKIIFQLQKESYKKNRWNRSTCFM